MKVKKHKRVEVVKGDIFMDMLLNGEPPKEKSLQELLMHTLHRNLEIKHEQGTPYITGIDASVNELCNKLNLKSQEDETTTKKQNRPIHFC